MSPSICPLVLVLVQAPSTRTIDDKWSFHLPSYFRWFLSFFEASTFQGTTLQLHNDLACNLVISNTFCCLWTTYLWKTFSLTLLMKSKFSLRPSVLVLRKKKRIQSISSLIPLEATILVPQASQMGVLPVMALKVVQYDHNIQSKLSTQSPLDSLTHFCRTSKICLLAASASPLD